MEKNSFSAYVLDNVFLVNKLVTRYLIAGMVQMRRIVLIENIFVGLTSSNVLTGDVFQQVRDVTGRQTVLRERMNRTVNSSVN